MSIGVDEAKLRSVLDSVHEVDSETEAKAVLAVCQYAVDAGEARELFDMLGLNPARAPRVAAPVNN